MSGWIFDAYACTFHEHSMEHVRAELLRGFDLSSWHRSKGMHGFTEGAIVTRNPEAARPRSLAHVWWGGTKGVHVRTQGEESPSLAAICRGIGRHRISRVDAKLDIIKHGEFDRIASALIAFAMARGIRISQVGDWANGKERTLYIGSRESVAMLRVYEKGQKERSHPDWVRIELEVKPKGDAGYACQEWEPEQFIGASPWVREALQTIGIDALKEQSLGTVWRPTDNERAKAAMLRQYGGILRQWAAEAPSLEDFARDVLQQVEKAREPLRVDSFEVPF